MVCYHLQAYKEDTKMHRKKKAAAASTANVSQPTLTEMFDVQQKLDTLVTEMIATDNQPFTFVSGYWFSEAGGCNGVQIQPKN